MEEENSLVHCHISNHVVASARVLMTASLDTTRSFSQPHIHHSALLLLPTYPPHLTQL